MRVLLSVMTIGFSTTPIYHTKVNPHIYFVTYLLYLNSLKIYENQVLNIVGTDDKIKLGQ